MTQALVDTPLRQAAVEPLPQLLEQESYNPNTLSYVPRTDLEKRQAYNMPVELQPQLEPPPADGDALHLPHCRARAVGSLRIQLSRIGLRSSDTPSPPSAVRQRPTAHCQWRSGWPLPSALPKRILPQ